uniref:Uncharacterized protein n=1 Tax=viral metagenome TaxID=1070528 RepID=A0A6C0J059_9ZZZZ
MTLPIWYIECAEDYLSILRSAHEYSEAELFEATRNQRLAEYKLMKEKIQTDDMDMAPVSDSPAVPAAAVAPPPSVNLRQYDNSVMYRGHLQADRPKAGGGGTRGFWENILK